MPWFFNREFALRPGILGICLCVGIAISSDALAAGPFDGTYGGTMKVTRSDNYPGCLLSDPPQDATADVKDNQFTEHFGEITVQGDVAPDGSFHAIALTTIGRTTPVEIKGRITGNSLEGELNWSNFCFRHLSLQKS